MTRRKKTEPAGPPGPTRAELVERLVLVLVAGSTPDQVARAAVDQLGIPAAQVDEMVAEAKAAIATAAAADRDMALGLALYRLNELYRKATKEGDYKNALAAQRELNKLQGLYRPSPPTPRTADTVEAAGDHPADPLQGLRLIG